MIKHGILFTLLISVSILGLGQKSHDYYISVPTGSASNCRLKFMSDSAIELSNVPRHMGGRFAILFNYKSSDTTIDILTSSMTKQDSLNLNTFDLSYFIKPSIRLSKIANVFIDNDNSIIYVRQKDFDYNPDVAYIIDGKMYIQDVGVTDGYGLVRKSPKTNKSLRKKLKGITKDNCTIENVKGLEAYRRYGMKAVFGAIIINTRH